MARSGTSLRTRIRNLWAEWKDRRDGHRKMRGTTNIGRATRDITGPTGWVFSNAWDKLDTHGDAYMKSFDPRVPASLFVSERDRTRFNQPMPVPERCIEDWDDNHGPSDRSVNTRTDRSATD